MGRSTGKVAKDITGGSKVVRGRTLEVRGEKADGG